MDIGTPLGLAFASGINAYLPLLAFATSARFLHLYRLNPNFAFITSDWFMLALIVLTIADLVLDKFPVIDHIWDAVHTLIRPLAGALVVAASYGQFYMPNINTGTAHNLVPQAMLAVTNISHMWMTIAATGTLFTLGSMGLVIMLIVGALLAAMSHTVKTTTRLFSTATTAGVFNIGLSIAEDVLVLVMILLSILVPIVALLLIGVFLLVFGPRLLRAWIRRIKGDVV
jgi:hypothetical protein